MDVLSAEAPTYAGNDGRRCGYVTGYPLRSLRSAFLSSVFLGFTKGRIILTPG